MYFDQHNSFPADTKKSQTEKRKMINKLFQNISSYFLSLNQNNFNNFNFFHGIFFGINLTLFLSFLFKYNFKLSFIINITEIILPLLLPQTSINKINENDYDKINIKREKHLKLPIGYKKEIQKKWVVNINTSDLSTISIYFYKPLNCKENCPIIIWIHGGGFVVGNAEMYEPITTTLANETGCIVAAIDYRKAPENKFPRPVLDCIEATQWIYDHAHEYNANNSKITVLGDSAGGNLTIIVTCELKNLIKLSIPIYPVVSFGLLSESKVRHYDAPMLKSLSMDWYNLRYFKNRKDLFDNLATPLYRTDLYLLPRTHVITADFDPLVDEGIEYVILLKKHGVNVTHKNYLNTVHGFFGAELLTHGTEALLETCELIKNHFHLTN